MAINGVRPVGDDQAWKREVEKMIQDLKDRIVELRSQVDYFSERS